MLCLNRFFVLVIVVVVMKTVSVEDRTQGAIRRLLSFSWREGGGYPRTSFIRAFVNRSK